VYKQRVPGARWVEVGACRGSRCGLCAARGSCMAVAEPCRGSDQHLLGLLSKGCGSFQTAWCSESSGELKFSSRVSLLEDAKQPACSRHAPCGSGQLAGRWPLGAQGGRRVLTLSSLPLAVISMQTQKPQRAAIPSAGRCVPFPLMQPFQWDGEELAGTSVAALRDPGHCISGRSKTITVSFSLSQTWAAKKPPAHPQLPAETSSWV